MEDNKKDATVQVSTKTNYLHWIFLLFMISISIAFYFSGGSSYLSLSGYQRYRNELNIWKNEHEILSGALYISIYFAIVTCSIPGATFLTLLGGVLFQQPVGVHHHSNLQYATLLALTGATSGACALFYIATTTFGGLMRRKVTNFPLGSDIENQLKQSAALSMLVLRLVPIFPFW